MRIRTIAMSAVACGALLGACGDDDDAGNFNRDDAIQQMVDSGLDEEQANCVVDAMVDEFGEDTLSSDRDPTEDEIARLTELMTDCVS